MLKPSYIVVKPFKSLKTLRQTWMKGGAGEKKDLCRIKHSIHIYIL